jgi:hypothetical protein
VTEAGTRIAELNAALRPDHSQIVAFGRHARVVPDGGALTELVSAQGETEVDRSASDLDAALAAARAELAPGHVPRLVLFSDGRATTGDVAAAVTQLAAAGIPVHVFPLAPRDLGDTWVEALRLPARLAPGGLIAATVDVGSQKLTSAVVEIRNGEEVLATRTVTLTPGQCTGDLFQILEYLCCGVAGFFVE